MERRKFGETFKARVSDDPNAIVEPKFWVQKRFGTRGESNLLREI